MNKLCKYIDKELDELENKVGMGGKLSRADIEDGKNLAKFKMALLTNEAMEDEDGYSNEYMRGGNSYRGASYARGRGSNARRDSMGRYSREDGYSRAEAREDFMEEVEELMHKAPDEHTRKKLERFMNEIK